jgi:Dyp-type peroxidase family
MTTNSPDLPSAYVQTRLQGITDLTVLAPIKSGFVAGSIETCTYLERLRRMLKALDTARHATRESALQSSPFSDLVGRLNIVHFFRFAIVPADASGNHRLLLNVTFDGGWEAYMRVIWRDLGSLLDAICCNCEDYPLAHEHSFDTYIRWVREHEIPGAFFYADSGDSLGDHRYREYLETLALSSHDPELADYFATVFRLDTARQALLKSTARSRKSPRATIAAGLKALATFHAQLRAYAIEPGGDAEVLQRFTQDLLKEFHVLVIDGVFKHPDFAPLAAQYAEQLQWFATPVRRWTPPAERLTLRRNEILAKIQGGILDSYADITHGCVALLRVQSGKAGEVIEFLSKWPVTAGDNASVDGIHRNVAFTYRGLQALGVAQTHLDKLPLEFKEGMEARAGILGDLRTNHPDHWQQPKINWPQHTSDVFQIELASVHVLVQLRTRHESTDHDLIATLKNELERLERYGLSVLAVQPMRRYMEGGQTVGHFGFADGISQPEVPDANRVGDTPSWSDAVRPGEILLGYGNARGDGPCPAQPDLLLDFGSFLVIRKLRQRLDVLNEVIAKQALKLTGNAEAAAAFAIEIQEKMMGRRRCGHVLAASTRPGNDFNFKEDPSGAQCPFHSHVRRLNPRLLDAESPLQPALLPRILRRGMSYGPRPDETNEAADRGILFMAYNASIAEQFEVLQRWIAGASANGFSTAESDPFLGVPTAGTSRTFRFLHNGRPLRVELGDKPFVQLEWGMYLFAPSLEALRQFKSLTTTQSRPARAPLAGAAPIAHSFAQWQRRLEDPEHRDAAWKDVRNAPGGVLKSEYGVLVGSECWVNSVLRDDGSSHSVRGYGERLQNSIGNGFLGQDPHDHGQDPHTAAVNRAIADISCADAFARASSTTSAVLTAMLDAQQQALGKREAELPLSKVIDEVLARLCKHWFGLPDDSWVHTGSATASPTPPRYPGHSFSVAQYVFWPWPSKTT